MAFFELNNLNTTENNSLLHHTTLKTTTHSKVKARLSPRFFSTSYYSTTTLYTCVNPSELSTIT